MATHDHESTDNGDARPALDVPAALDRVDGDSQLLLEIAGIFLAGAPGMLQGVRAALAAADPAAVSRAAHLVRGSVLTFAAGPASEAALALEQLGRAGTLVGAEALVRTLERELERLVESLKLLTARGLKDSA